MELKIESGIELQKEMLIFFMGEKLPMTVKAVNEKFAIATRQIHRWYDADLIKYQVEKDSYLTFTEAWNDLKNEMIYTIIDLENNIRGPHNLIMGGTNFKKQKEIEILLQELTNGTVEISHRNRKNYNLDFERTIRQ